MSSFLMVFQRIQLATADVSDKLFKAAAVPEAPVHGIVRKLRLVLMQNEPLTRVLDELVADALSGGLRDCRSYVGEADRQSSAGGFCMQGASRKSMCDCRTSKRAGLRLTFLGAGVDHGAAPSTRRSAIAEVANESSRRPR